MVSDQSGEATEGGTSRMVWSRPPLAPPWAAEPMEEARLWSEPLEVTEAGGESRGARTVTFARGNLGLLEGPAAPNNSVCRTFRRGGAAGRDRAGLGRSRGHVPPPRLAVERSAHFPVRGGSAGNSRFASCQRGRERAGRGVGAAERVSEPVPCPARDPGPPAPPAAASEVGAASRAPHSPARRSLPLAPRPGGRAPETLSGRGW